MKYKKKPVVIDAIQWTGTNGRDICLRWVPSVQPIAEGCSVANYGDEMTVTMPEASMEISVGDWILRGVIGELYPCRDDVFRQTYDAVADADSPATHEVVFVGLAEGLRSMRMRCTCGYEPIGPGDVDAQMTMHIAFKRIVEQP